MITEKQIEEAFRTHKEYYKVPGGESTNASEFDFRQGITLAIATLQPEIDALKAENYRLQTGIATINAYMHGAYPGDQIADTKTLCKELLNPKQ